MNTKYMKCGRKLKWKPVSSELNDFQFMEYKRHRAFPADCNLDRKRVDKLKAAILEGLALPFNWALVYVKDSGVTYRVNGKHSKEAIQELLEENRILLSHAGLHVFMTTYEVDNMDEARQLYQSFDDPDLPRGFEERIRSETYDDPELGKVNKDTVAAFANAIHELRGGSKHAPIEEKVHYLKTELKECITCYLPLFTGNISTLRRAPVIKAMIIQWLWGKDKAIEFWSAVVDDSLPRNETPARLFDYLSKHKVYHGTGIHHKDAVSADEMLSICNVCWNAWSEGKKRFSMKYDPNHRIWPIQMAAGA